MADDGGLEGYEDWQMVGNTYFSRRELYAMEWGGGGGAGVNLAFMRVHAGCGGGPLALQRDMRKLVLFVGSTARPDLQLYNAAGGVLGRVLWDKGRVVAAGWGSQEQLLVVEEGGQVHAFSPLGERLQGAQFSLGSGCEADGVEEAAVFRDGVVALTPSRHLWCVASAAEPRPTRFPDPCPSPDSVLHCFTLLPPGVSPSGSLEVVAAVDATIRVIDASEAAPTTVFEGPILRLAASPCGRYVAGYAQDSTIHVWTADLSDVVTRVGLAETEDDLIETLGGEGVPDTLPDTLVWCGSDAVLLFWEGTGALLVSLEGAWRWWDCGGGAAAFVPEVDGVRVLASERHWLLRRVPPPLASVLELGSTSPGALLYDARRLFDAQDARATGELLDILGSGELPAAVSSCLGAAAAELDPSRQAGMLKASCYGRAFLALEGSTGGGTNSGGTPSGRSSAVGTPQKQQQQQQYETSAGSIGAGAGSQGAAAGGRRQTVEVARRLRLLNALREPGIGMPLTMPQLEAEGPAAVVQRLVGRRHYLLAVRVCQTLGLSTDQVLVRWACDKISAAAMQLPDEELLEALQSKLGGQPGVQYAAVAAHAAEAGRRRLAALLLDHERVAARQVPLLLELGEDERALEKATESGDSDLVFQVVHTMWRRLERSAGAGSPAGGSAAARGGQERFWAAVARRPAALSFFAKYYRNESPQLLLELHEALGQHEAAAELHLHSALDLALGGAPEAQVQRELARARDDYTRATDPKQGRDHRFEATAVQQLAKLREQQLELQASSRREGFVGLSAADTVRQCLRLGLKDQATKLARELKIPEKQFLLLSVQTLAAQRDWGALQHLAGKLDRRSPLGMEAVVAVARANSAPPEVLRWLVEHLSGDNALARKAQLYSELGMAREARALAELAEQQGGGAAGMLGSLRGALGGTVSGFMTQRSGSGRQ